MIALLLFNQSLSEWFNWDCMSVGWGKWTLPWKRCPTRTPSHTMSAFPLPPSAYSALYVAPTRLLSISRNLYPVWTLILTLSHLKTLPPVTTLNPSKLFTCLPQFPSDGKSPPCRVPAWSVPIDDDPSLNLLQTLLLPRCRLACNNTHPHTLKHTHACVFTFLESAKLVPSLYLR